MRSLRTSVRCLLVALPPLLIPVACTPKGGPATVPAGAASGSASAGRAPDPLADGESLRVHKGDGDDRKREAPPAKPPPRVGLSGGLAAVDAAEYETAKTELQKAAANPKEKGAATVGLARVALETGHYADAVKLADEAARVDVPSKIAAAPIKIRALARMGKLDDAIKAGQSVRGEPEARRARLALGEVFLRMGKSREGQAELMTIIEDFNKKTITTKDGEGMSLVGRAAHLLRSKRDANEAYDDAERAGFKSAELFLWRAELFLEAYNIGRADEMVRSAMKAAPDLAAAHILFAEVKLVQTLDFDTAEKAVQKALSINEKLPEAFRIRAGIALRDLETEAADKALDQGLAIDPTDLDVLSMRAAVRFLADDKPGFERAKKAVLDRNAEYARLYQIVADYADWEHRYAEIATMMKEATKLDPDDGRNFVTLGLNQIRVGQEKEGVQNLDIGFKKDRFNVRAFNTLNLYERDIPQKYEDVTSGVFTIRYPKNEKKVLERYVPGLLDAAWKDMTKRYGFTPHTPVGVELYGSREHFSVRTSGLPNVGIQGVCFGETLAAISPKAEAFNWGMVVWHEVGHVFAIQQSKNHVPRWFTEGLSEYETLAHRSEWRREEDPALWLALKRDKVPAIEQMNRAFTHADDAHDMTIAYYASSQISTFLVEKYGMPKLTAMLRAWGEGKRTPEVIKTSLGIDGPELDKQFRAWLSVRLARYEKQYVPDLRVKDPKRIEEALKKDPKSADAHVDFAVFKLATGDREGAIAELGEAKTIDPKNAAQRFVRAKLLIGQKKADEAKKELEAMVAEGHDGFAVQMLMADLFEGEPAKAAARFEAAAALDPTQSEPLQALVDMARKAKDEDRELKFLRLLAQVDQHDRRVWRRLLGKLVAKGLWDEAKQVGEGALFVDIHGAETHLFFAQALLATKDRTRAIFEAETALLCEPIKADVAARANVLLARAWLEAGDNVKAKAARDEALRQDEDNAEAKGLVIP
jgi:tetratricopeptide (TPR) repeat protein